MSIEKTDVEQHDEGYWVTGRCYLSNSRVTECIARTIKDSRGLAEEIKLNALTGSLPQPTFLKVITTLIEAFVLVFIVVFIFLQDLRSTLIPAIAVPVAIIGTFFFLQLFGFSINLLTLFALVLAIGIVVGDEMIDTLNQLAHRAERATPYGAPGDQRKEAFDQVQPRAVRRHEMQMPARTRGQPPSARGGAKSWGPASIAAADS